MDSPMVENENQMFTPPSKKSMNLTDSINSILVVEDDLPTRKILEKTLSKDGNTVRLADNGNEALKIFKKNYFPIILTDWLMPVLNGLELCQQIRTISKSYVYIIILTSKGDKINIVEGLEAGADDYLTKPFAIQELLARINTGKRILALEKSLKNANEEIKRFANIDPLTKCFNRAFLTDQLPQEVKRAQRYNRHLSIILCDIDYFKKINDSYGHLAGDHILQEFVRIIQAGIRLETDWVARYGGEEFIVLLPETDLDGAFILAERLRSHVADTELKYMDTEIQITASFGISHFNPKIHPKNTSTEDIIMQADLCLYKAKANGRNCVIAEGLNI